MKVTQIFIAIAVLTTAYACEQTEPFERGSSASFDRSSLSSLSDSMLISVDTSATEVLVAGVAGNSALTVHYKAPEWKSKVMPFGQIIPFNAHWTPSEEVPCLLSLEKPIYFENQLLDEGDYFLYIMPSEEEWEVFITTVASPTETISFTRPVEELADLQKRLLIAIKRLNNKNSEFSIAWHDRKITFNIEEART